MNTPISPITISAEEYCQRRTTFAKHIGPKGIAIIPASRAVLRNGDVAYPFRQNSDFCYLSNFPEPDALLVLRGGKDNAHCALFCNPHDALRELWEGARLGADKACAHSGVDEAFDLSAMDELLPSMLSGRDIVYCPVDSNLWLDNKLKGWMRAVRRGTRAGVRTPSSLSNLSTSLHEMRLIKSAQEVAIMRLAGSISIDAHARAMAECRVGGWEYQLEAALFYEFGRRGARHWAYPPIVGAGQNACVLHYSENRAPLEDGSMVLIDAGCELEGYASDISRSFPVNGRFSSEQAALYDVVMAAQQTAIKSALPGNRFEDVHLAAVKVLLAGMVDLGLLKGKVSTLLRGNEWQRFYPHRTGHWLGLDVHDVGAYAEQDGSSRVLCAGMVMTVEPGLYIQSSDTSVAKHWRGLGVRVEDDLLITEREAEAINPTRPRSREELQACVGCTTDV